MISSDISSRLDLIDKNLALNDQRISNIKDSFENAKKDWFANRKVELIQEKRSKGFVVFSILAICFIFSCTVISCIYYPSLIAFSITVGAIGCAFFAFLIFRNIFNDEYDK